MGIMNIEKIKIALSKKYEFIKLLGKGGFAEVYLAKDKLLEREVAVKILLSQHADDSEVIERFIREAKLYASFDHKNLIPIYETGIIENTAYIVMKYIKGASLKDIIENDGELDSTFILIVIKGMASALKYIHNKEIIHRDIKPANILIEIETNRMFLADFGIARPISSKTLTQTGMLIGTPYYISPEQIKNGKTDKRSDIYALGTTLYEVISGAPIFKCETPIEVLYKHVNETPKPIASINPNITDEIKYIVEKCLEKDPDNRFQDANEILDVISTGKTRQIKNNYTNKTKNNYKDRVFKLGIIILFISGIIFGLNFFYPSIFDILQLSDDNKNNIKKDLVKKVVPAVTLKTVPIDSSNDDQKYKRFFDLSKKFFEKEDYISANEYLKKAKKYKVTFELYKFDEKIQKELNKELTENNINENVEIIAETRNQKDLNKELIENDINENVEIITETKNKKEIPLNKDILNNKVKIDITKNEKSKKNDVLSKKTNPIKPSINDQKYTQFYDISLSYYNRGDFISADKNIRKAKEFKNTFELYNLKEKIQMELEKEKKKKILKKKTIKKISLFKLDKTIRDSYSSKINLIRVVIPKKRKFFIDKGLIKGQLTLKLKINIYGRVSFQNIKQDNLIVIPNIARKNILKGMFNKLQSIRFKPPLDKKGEKVVLENWRVTFSVSKYKNKIILKRKV